MQAFWFGIIAVLWAGFFVLEGFDFGVGVLLPFVSRDEATRLVAVRSIGPVWDGNEVWLLVAGGATFAAFPEWYASMFSGFYLAFALLLVGLILRGIGIEYRGKAATDEGRRWCDLAFVGGSLVPALLLGVAFGNVLRGLNMTSSHDVTSSFLSLLNPYALLGGVVTLLLFAFHGAVYLQLRTTGPVRERACELATPLGLGATASAVAFVLWTATFRGTVLSWLIVLLIAGGLIRALMASRRELDGHAFAATAVAALLVPVWVFACLWPDVLPARNDAALSLTVHNASSTPYTLKVMTVVALVMTPVVLAYQAWSYWVFRARVTGAEVDDGYGGVSRIVRNARRSAEETLGRHADQPDEAGEAPAPTP
jgi:cytochrome d ubiquinol oxidase subunit II